VKVAEKPLLRMYRSDSFGNLGLIMSQIDLKFYGERLVYSEDRQLTGRIQYILTTIEKKIAVKVGRDDATIVVEIEFPH